MQRQSTRETDRPATEEELVREHLPLVHYAVNELASRVPRHVSRDDLVSAAMFGLAQAARTFDPSRGVTFPRFARSRITGALLDELRGRDWASRSVRSKARSLQATADQLTAQLSRTPTVEELAEEMGVDIEEVRRLTADVHRATVLNYESLFGSGETDAESILPSAVPAPEDILSARERTSYLLDAVVSLPERLRTVVVGYFFDERPMQDIANELGVTESRVSQMRAEALELLKDGMTANLEPSSEVDRSEPVGRVARRKAAYYATVASASDYRTRLAATPVSIHDRLAEITATG
jgi:RNA polymerase sigma factor FliA